VEPETEAHASDYEAPPSVAQILLRSLTHAFPLLLSPVATARLIVARLGETDAFDWWASRVWESGDLALRPLFPITWPRQRLVLSLQAARSAERADLIERGAWGKSPSLFWLDPILDARFDHNLQLLDIETSREIGDYLADVSAVGVVELGMIGSAVHGIAAVNSDQPIKGKFSEICRRYSCVDTANWAPPFLES
jgi:hypothetical protein